MGNMRKLKKGVAKSTQSRAADAMPDMGPPVDQELEQGQEGQMGVMGDPKAQQEATPEQKAFAKGMHSMIMNFMYREETKNSVAEMIQSGNPEKTIPMTAQTVFTQLETMMRSNNKPLDLEGKALATLIIFGETVESAQALGVLPAEPDQARLEKMLTKTMQDKIHEGLKDGSIDPIELQEKVEPYLDDEMKGIGMEYAGEAEINTELNEGMVKDVQHQKQIRGMKAKQEALKSQVTGQQTALQGLQQAKPEEGM